MSGRLYHRSPSEEGWGVGCIQVMRGELIKTSGASHSHWTPLLVRSHQRLQERVHFCAGWQAILCYSAGDRVRVKRCKLSAGIIAEYGPHRCNSSERTWLVCLLLLCFCAHEASIYCKGLLPCQQVCQDMKTCLLHCRDTNLLQLYASITYILSYMSAWALLR